MPPVVRSGFSMNDSIASPMVTSGLRSHKTARVVVEMTHLERANNTITSILAMRISDA